MNGPSTRLSKPGPPVRPWKGKELGTVGELGSSYARTGGSRDGAGGAKRDCTRNG